MNKILYSKTRLNAYDTFYEIEFNDCIADLLSLDDVQKLAVFKQHFFTTRLQHSINVSYHSYLLCKLFRFDFRSAARAGLLHDLFLYDWHEVTFEERHAFAHPKNALITARKNVALNQIEEDAIVKHMWPLCKSAPKYKESFIVSLSDKYCCAGEIISAGIGLVKTKMMRLIARHA
ncbi:MAG: hypothetical protein LBU77_02595 [Clostridiales bacterium]|nr:hypothetical protein [Clostridiales bacterium]